jgi:hypothetical protein
MFNLMYSTITASDTGAGILSARIFLHQISIRKTIVSDHRAHFPKKPKQLMFRLIFIFLLTAMWILSYSTCHIRTRKSRAEQLIFFDRFLFFVNDNVNLVISDLSSPRAKHSRGTDPTRRALILRCKDLLSFSETRPAGLKTENNPQFRRYSRQAAMGMWALDRHPSALPGALPPTPQFNYTNFAIA